MRNFIVATVLSLFATGAFACCDFSVNIDKAAAGAAAGGYGSNVAKATSRTSRNGSAVNNAISGTSIVTKGYARAGEMGRGRRAVNGYEAGVEVQTGTYAATYSNNSGRNTYGGAYADAEARALGAAGGIATSKTINWDFCPWDGLDVGGAAALSAAGGIVSAESDATAHTYGRGETEAGTVSGALAGLDVEGVADTDSDEFRASASDSKRAFTSSESWFEGRPRNGFTYGGADAWAAGGVLAGGFVWNASVDVDVNDKLPKPKKPKGNNGGGNGDDDGTNPGTDNCEGSKCETN